MEADAFTDNKWIRASAWCSGCEKQLPRQSFYSKGNYRLTRKCVNCRKERGPGMNEWISALAWCSGCEKQLPRQSFLNDGKWPKRSNAERKCVRCRKERSSPGMWKCVQCLEVKPKEHGFELWKNRSGSTQKISIHGAMSVFERMIRLNWQLGALSK